MCGSRFIAGAVRLMVVALMLGSLFGAAEAARKPKPKKPVPCPGGRFVVQGTPVIANFMGSDALVLAGSKASLASGCDDVTARIKVRLSSFEYATASLIAA